jgi:hypothetical protein
MLRVALILFVLVGCVRPAPLGLASVQVCVNAETGARWEGPPRPTKGASVCASFERAPEPAAE